MGPHTIGVGYAGNANVFGEVTEVPINVNKNNPAVSLVSSANPSTPNQLVTFTASAIPSVGSLPAAGSISFFDGATLLGAVNLNASGAATLSTSALSIAAHNITASYGGNANFGAASANLTQTVNSGPTLTILKSHSETLPQGQPGVTYSIAVINVGSAATAGTVMVTEQPPTGLTLVSMGGSGWTCAALPVCTRSDALPPNGVYSALTATVNVASDAPSTVTNQVTVTGGATASDTASVAVFLCDLNLDGLVNVADVQTEINVALGVVAAVAADDLNFDGVVNVADVQKDINAALGLGCQ